MFRIDPLKHRQYHILKPNIILAILRIMNKSGKGTQDEINKILDILLNYTYNNNSKSALTYIYIIREISQLPFKISDDHLRNIVYIYMDEEFYKPYYNFSN